MLSSCGVEIHPYVTISARGAGDIQLVPAHTHRWMQGQESRTYFVMHPGLKYNKENK
jgi:hypothetical protein